MEITALEISEKNFMDMKIKDYLKPGFSDISMFLWNIKFKNESLLLIPITAIKNNDPQFSISKSKYASIH